MLLFFIRHGDPIYDPDSLTPLGQRQAEALSKRLALYGIDEIYSSSSERAKMTARPTCELTKKEMTVLDWANEAYAWRDFTVPTGNGGRTWCFYSSEYKKLFNSDKTRRLAGEWYKSDDFKNDNFAFGVERIQTEADNFIASLGYRHDRENHCYIPENRNEKRIALFAHQGFGIAFLSCVLDIPYPQFSTHFDFTAGSMSVIEFGGGDVVYPKALELSNDSHIYREGLPTAYHNRIYF